MASGPGLGYDIGASLANSADSATNPFEEAGTVFIFGNSDNPNLAATQTPTQTDTATATTSTAGPATSTNPVSSGVSASPATALTAALSSGGNLTTYLLLAAIAVAAYALGKGKHG